MQLTPKEASLLKDLKGQENLCVEKYTRYSSEACDPQLKNLFSQIAAVERQHVATIEQLEQGTVPQGGGGSQSMPSFESGDSSRTSEQKQSDCYLCNDALAMEKHASGMYDTCIFEFADENTRNTLNHIQKEEQNHGKMIYDYMVANSMY